ncbi:MAG: MurR/RpiR family transcriptional regulator [Streptococcaceae bacterium]|jgi:DNA-binding MurR/RpiR family transcriptional regulator|nr:MurR/RpiR family transcriptional regulator [Streptococcaceae bacterium]
MGKILEKFGNLDYLSTSERQMLTTLDDQPELLSSNLTELAVTLFSSNTSIIRLAKKLGYSGFSEFKFDLLQSPVKSDTNSLSNLTDNLTSFTNLTQQAAFKDKISQFAKSITKADNIYIAGVGSSKTLAEYFAHRLNQLDKSAVYVYDNALLDLLPNLTSQDRKSLVIYVSISGETLRLVNSAKKVHNLACPILAITNVRTTSLGRLADSTIATDMPMTAYHNYDITPRTFQIAVIDLILENLFQQKTAR